jgi:hypothetical protein
MDDASILAIVETYPGLRAALSVRVNELRFTHLHVDEIAGLQTGYTGKILCGSRHFGDKSLGQLLAALGLKLAVVRSRGKQNDFCEQTLSLQVDARKKTLSERGKKGGKTKNGRMTDVERKQHASMMATKRWRDWRETKRKQAERERKAARRMEKSK